MDVIQSIIIWFGVPTLFCIVGVLMEVFLGTERWTTLLLIFVGSCLGVWLAERNDKRLREKRIARRHGGG